MSPSDPQNAALVAHIVSQVESNIEFLAAQNYISAGDAAQILSRLPRSDSNVQSNNVPAFPAPAAPSFPTPTPRATPRVAPRAAAPVPAPAPPSSVPQARALWTWSGQDGDDLSIEQGDIIEIVEETNADWWTGRVNGRQGVFPASYVEKIKGQETKGKPVYKPFKAVFHGSDAPPPAPVETNNNTNSVGLQEAPGQAEKKSKYGAFGNTMAHSAAGGVGFGAGAAIGGGLVRAIF